ncbi:MAG: hypothetical protein HKN09_10165 [Saprospiraceae bacterium]|nr:hypothetical protein [Saprospiraceae bacterium]
MRAFSKNIDALESKLSDFFQKWEGLLDKNELLIQRNKQLEAQIMERNTPEKKPNEAEIEGDIAEDAFDKTYIINAIEQYMDRIDACIEKINLELNG